MGLRLAARDLHVQINVGTGRQQQLQSLFKIDTLKLAASDSMALYGPSGSGKTTLLHVLGGLQRITDAQVCWHSDSTDAIDLMQLDDGTCDRWRLQHVGMVSARVMDVLLDVCRQRHITLMVATHDLAMAQRFDHAVQLQDQRLSAWACP